MLHREVTLADMAHVACMSESYFLRTFKQAFNQTPHQYLVDLRLEKARALLRTTSFSITEISAAVGFQSLGSFSWLFSRRHSLSPDAYRRALRDSHESGGYL
jgi:transcriptional regulator GlxA family with amidase domain